MPTAKFLAVLGSISNHRGSVCHHLLKSREIFSTAGDFYPLKVGAGPETRFALYSLTKAKFVPAVIFARWLWFHDFTASLRLSS